MTKWCHLPTIFEQRWALRMVGLVLAIVAIITTLFFVHGAAAQANTERTVSFQGRLLTESGSPVPDGNYNMQFKIYQGGAGDKAGNPGGELKWKETYNNSQQGSGGVKVKSGYFAVNLGSKNKFGTQVNWDSPGLWLSMNVAGNAKNCASFGEAPCEADGEMLPMKPITAAPYALNAGALEGKGADDFVQIGEGVQTDNSNNSSVYINKTGAGNLIQLQKNGQNAFTVANDGSLRLGGNGDKSISVGVAKPNTAGGQLSISAGGGGSGASGGNLVLSGGAAGGSSANGGNLVLSGGAGMGDGAGGLVILGTPTFSTVTSDANCYTEGNVVADSCTITDSSVNNSSAVIVGFNAEGKTATLPDPILKTPGRIMYVIAAEESKDFTLSIGGSNQVKMRASTATTVLWSGANWVLVSGANSAEEDDKDEASELSAGGNLKLSEEPKDSNLVVLPEIENKAPGKKLAASEEPAESTILSIKGSTKYASDGKVDDKANFRSNWKSVGDVTITHNTSEGQSDNTSAQITASDKAGDGIRNQMVIAPEIDKEYQVSVYAKLVSGDTFEDFTVRYSPDGGATFQKCSDYNTQTVTDSEWINITCGITAKTVGTNPHIYFTQPTDSETSRTYLLDSFSFEVMPDQKPAADGKGSKNGTSKTSKSEKEKPAKAPKETNKTLPDSMYFDTTIGKLQCSREDGWGDCFNAPDTFITLSPEYSGAVMNGQDIGTITSDLCSDKLNVNDGSEEQPAVCGKDETYNFYRWTSKEKTPQTRSIYITQKLPANFKEFVPGSLSLMGKTDNDKAKVDYRVYRDNESTGLTSCGEDTEVSIGEQATWQQVASTGAEDPSTCDFKAGDSILIRINLTSSEDSNAYVSDLGFVFRNN